MKVSFILAGLVGGSWFYITSYSSVSLGPGELAPIAPVQAAAYRPQVIEMGDFSVVPLASFQIEAKVLGKKRYYLGSEAKVSPVDLALGWGQMSDESVLETIDIFQSRRKYRWSSSDSPIGKQEIQLCSANMHIIPATDEVEKTLNKVREGQIVAIDGYLVRVDGKNGWRWTSSLTRSDTGSGACEIIYVNELEIRDFQSK